MRIFVSILFLSLNGCVYFEQPAGLELNNGWDWAVDLQAYNGTVWDCGEEQSWRVKVVDSDMLVLSQFMGYSRSLDLVVEVRDSYGADFKWLNIKELKDSESVDLGASLGILAMPFSLIDSRHIQIWGIDSSSVIEMSENLDLDPKKMPKYGEIEQVRKWDVLVRGNPEMIIRTIETEPDKYLNLDDPLVCSTGTVTLPVGDVH